MIDILFSILLIIPLFYGGLTDYKNRTIPNGVCITIFFIGLLSTAFLPHDSSFFIPFWLRTAGVLPAVLMFFIACSKGGIGGGDIKLTAVLGFAVGFYALVPIFFITTLTALLWAVKNKKKSVPLACFLFIGVLLFCILRLYTK